MLSDAEVIRIADKIHAIRKDPKHPFNSICDGPAHEAVVGKMADLHGRLFPDKETAN